MCCGQSGATITSSSRNATTSARAARQPAFFFSLESPLGKLSGRLLDLRVLRLQPRDGGGDGGVGELAGDDDLQLRGGICARERGERLHEDGAAERRDHHTEHGWAGSMVTTHHAAGVGDGCRVKRLRIFCTSSQSAVSRNAHRPESWT